MGSRRGFTLFEMMVVVAVVAIVTLIGLPRMMSSREQGDVRGARNRMVALFAMARTNAIGRSRPMTLDFDPNQVVMWEPRPGGGRDTLWVEDFHGGMGVTVGYTSSSYTFDPRGIGAGSSITTISLSKGSHADSVAISGFGRVVAQ